MKKKKNESRQTINDRHDALNNELQRVIHPYSAPAKVVLSTVLGRAMDRLSYRRLFFIMAAVLVVCAAYYYLAAPNQGMISNIVDKDLSFGTALYFSVITFTSLGYGDISAEGFGRVIAALEVLVGVTSVAVFVGKLASERASTALLLLFTSDNQRRLTEFRKDLEEISGEIDLYLREHNLDAVAGWSKSVATLLPSIRNYLTFQSHQGRLASFGNQPSLRQLYVVLSSVQQKAAAAITFTEVKKEVKETLLKVVLEVRRIAEVMIRFHAEDLKSKGSFLAMGQCAKSTEQWYERYQLGEANVRHLGMVSDKLLNHVLNILCSNEWHKDLSKNIAHENQMTHKLVQKCIKNLVDTGRFEIPGSKESLRNAREIARRQALTTKKELVARRSSLMRGRSKVSRN